MHVKRNFRLLDQARALRREMTRQERKLWYDFLRADSVIALQDKMGWYREDRSKVHEEKWAEIREVLAEAPDSGEMLGYVKSIGLDVTQFEEMYGEEKIKAALKFAKDLKDRYSVLWLAYDLLD